MIACRRRTAWALLAFGCVLTTRAVGQITVAVGSREGYPIGSARVEVWDAAGMVGTWLSTGTGVATLPSTVVAEGRFIVVKAIGFAPVRVETPLVDAGRMEVVLRSIALTLAPLEVRGEWSCDAREERAARQRWREGARGYASIDSLDGLAVIMESQYSILTDSIPALVAPIDPRSWSVRGSSSVAWDRWRRRIAGDGFKVAGRAGSDLNGTGVVFEIPLQDDFSQIFADPLFGAEHRFTFGLDSLTLQFCPRSRARGGLRGVLRLRPDYSFEDVSWSTVSPGSYDHTGGFILFAPAGSFSHLLLPLTSSSWRERFPNRITELIHQFRSWEVGPQDSLPILLDRHRTP